MSSSSMVLFFFKQKTAYEMRISDWSSDVCSSDLYYFSAVVDHGGFAAAERALGIPKSRLSRRISQLETELGVRLLQRSTRRFAVTDVGQGVYRHAQSDRKSTRLNSSH